MDVAKGGITLHLSVRRETSVPLQWGENIFSFPGICSEGTCIST